MNKNEFKINNHVILAHGGDKKAKVIGLDKKKIFLETMISGEVLEIHASYTDIKPIELTIKKLEKLGFAYNASTNTATIENKYVGVLSISLEDFSVCIADSARSHDVGECAYCPWTTIKYLHQLQNLYYSLTQRELIV
jgi:hypothetical protein